MKIVITAPAGKMGKLIVREALKRKNEFEIIGAVGNPNSSYIGKDISVASMTENVGALIYKNIEEIIDKCDGVIDFSRIKVSMEVLDSCVKYKKSLMIGTTGFSDIEEKKILDASKIIAISESHNTSKAVNLLYQTVAKYTKAIGKESDIEIIDYHDNKKIDMPSGTGKVFASIVRENLKDKKVTNHSLRIGNVSSSHTIVFGMDGERIELTHHAYDFSTFAKGALDCMLYLKDKKPGMYSSLECLGLE